MARRGGPALRAGTRRPGDGTVALLNGTARKGLGTRVQGELVERASDRLPTGGTVVGNATRQDVAESEVQHVPERAWEAGEIAAALGITRVREVSSEELADLGAPGSAVIAVVLGVDVEHRMR